jgi:hypothetical protein|tara:strand:- start:2556 stop:4442 length:1887 start_codon:yes stop_codon:yes gene_type:complete
MADKGLFPRLRRLFSTDVIIRNTGGNQLNVFDINKIQQSGEIETNSLVDRFNRIYSNSSTSLLGAQQNLNYQYLRPQLYSEYDAMDTDAIIASALDIIADESTLKNDMGEVLQIKSPDEDIQKILYNLFYDVLNIEFNLWPWIRNLCKYGDFFLKLEIAEKFGVYNVIPYTAFHIERMEGMDRENPNEIKFRFDPDGIAASDSGYYSVPNQGNTPNSIVFDNYEMAHFRLLTDMNFLPYGRSYIEPARKLFKQYVLMEDAMLIHRIVRAPEKRIFYMNVGAIPPNEVDAFMEKTLSKLKRTPHVDEKTGEYNLRYNMQNLLEDYYIPVRGNDSSTKIESANGLQWDGIEDVNYLRDKLFAALKVPKAFMGYDENTDGKATLAAQDIRFARTIERIQRIVVSELYKIALVHLYTQGYREEQLANFTLSLTTPSIIYDQERVALMKEKMDLAAQMTETNLFPTDFIYDHLFHLSEDQYDDFRDLIREDAKRKFRIDQIEAEGNDPVETGKSYGTPHDLASLYGKGRMYSDPGEVPEPETYDEKNPLGRPKEKVSKRNTQDDNFGKDRLGAKGMKKDYNDTNKSPLTLENNSRVLQHQSMLNKIPVNSKKLVFEQNSADESLLDEANIKEQ